VLKEADIGNLIQRLQNQKVSLSLMLNIIHRYVSTVFQKCMKLTESRFSYTIKKAYTNVGTLSRSMDRLLQTTDDIAKRLQSIVSHRSPNAASFASSQSSEHRQYHKCSNVET